MGWCGIEENDRKNLQKNEMVKLKNGCRLGKYEILDVLGQGGNGVVYLAKDTILGKKWAIKQIPKIKREDNTKTRKSEMYRVINTKKQLDEAHFKESSQKQIEEALVMRELDHPGIPRITEQMEDESFFYIVMDYCKGESLWRLYNQKQATVDEIIDWGIQLCDILNYLHGQNPPIIFRDIKPGNIICDAYNRLKLVDFGIAKTDYYEHDTKGTRGFAAPEQYKGKYSIQSDIYNLGATLLWCMQGQQDRGLRRILKKAMAQVPAKRYRDGHLFKKELLHLQRKRKERKLQRKIYLIIALFVISAGVLGSFTNEWLVSILEKIETQQDKIVNIQQESIEAQQEFSEYLNSVDTLLQSRYEEERQSYIEKLKMKKESLIHILEKLEGGAVIE